MLDPLHNELESLSKIDRAHKNYLTPKIWEETHLREIFYGTLIFQQSSMICIGRHVGGHILPLQHGGHNYFCIFLVKRLIVTLRCALNVTTSSFQHFPWSLSAKYVFTKKKFIILKKHILVTRPATNLLISRKLVRVWKTKSLLFCLRYDLLIVFSIEGKII